MIFKIVTTNVCISLLQTPFGMGAMGGLPGMANLGMGSANFMEMQQRMQSEVLGNPDMLRQIMDSPLTQSLMSNPEIMRSLIQANPQMQQVRRATKSWPHLIKDPITIIFKRNFELSFDGRWLRF